MSLLSYLRIWLACVRYSVVRTMMFRFDFLLWVAVDTAWMGVNLLLIEVLFRHTDSLAGWNKAEMQLLLGTSMLLMRLFIGLFFTNLFGIERAVRDGTFDFYLAQPGNPLFMISTRKLDFDGLVNTILALALIVHALGQLGIAPSLGTCIAYVGMILLGLLFHYATVVLLVSLSFWIVRLQGIEGGYFSLFEISRLPRGALRGVMEVVFVYAIPASIVANFPAETLRHGLDVPHTLWLIGVVALWFTAAVTLFNRGLRRYASASS